MRRKHCWTETKSFCWIIYTYSCLSLWLKCLLINRLIRFKRSVCRIQNSCFLHLINLPTNACWKRGYERWILLFRGWFFLPDSPVCYNWCPAYKQVACELSINCECSHRIGSYSHKSFISYMFSRKKLGQPIKHWMSQRLLRAFPDQLGQDSIKSPMLLLAWLCFFESTSLLVSPMKRRYCIISILAR